MVEYSLDADKSTLVVRPKSALEAADFARLALAMDPHIEKTGSLAGLVIEAPAFPGWEGLGALAAHIRFVRDHHRRIRKVAVVTDSALGRVLERLAAPFVAARIRRFKAGGLEAARQWVLE